MMPNEVQPPVIGTRLDLTMSEAIAERAELLKLEKAQPWHRFWKDTIGYRLAVVEKQIIEHAVKEHQKKETSNG